MRKKKMKVKLGQLATVQTGYSFRSRLEASGKGDVSVIQMKDLLDDNTADCSRFTKVDMGFVKEHHLARKGDLVFRSRGQVTTAAILRESPGKAVVAAPLLRIRIRKPEMILSEYLNWFISQRDAQKFLESRAGGTVQKMINKQAIEHMEIALPSLEQQERIVELAALADREQVILKTVAEKRDQYISAVLLRLAKGE
jgi:hypothetical protein